MLCIFAVSSRISISGDFKFFFLNWLFICCLDFYKIGLLREICGEVNEVLGLCSNIPASNLEFTRLMKPMK